MRKRRLSSAFLISVVILLLVPHAAPTAGAASGKSAKSDVVIELTWAGDIDLDLHVTGLRDREERFSVWSLNRSGPGCRLESEAGSGGGTERVRISESDHGPYQVYVYDSSDTGTGGDEAFADSGAEVRIFNGAGLKDIYDVPEVGYGNLWSVCAIDGGSVTSVNEMSVEEKPELVGSDPESTLLPGDIIMGSQPDANIPTKWSHVGMYVGDGMVVEAFGTDIPTQLFPIDDWEYPEMSFASYFRVISADAAVREKAVEFVLEQVEEEAPYDIRFHTKQVDGDSWYCTEIVWAAYLLASNGKINIEQSPDPLGVYPWEIEHSDQIALVGGHYEESPRRNWFKMAWVGITRLNEFFLAPARERLAVSMVNSFMHPIFIFFFFLCISVSIWYSTRRKPVL